MPSKQQQAWEEIYDGFDQHTVGIGTGGEKYSSKKYKNKKQQTLLIGALSRIIYSGFEHDPRPLILSMAYEPAYNTIIGLNLNYAPVRTRNTIIKWVIKSNMLRIKKNKPIIVDYPALKKAVPKIGMYVRRYKASGIRVTENVPLKEWTQAVKSRGQFIIG